MTTKESVYDEVVFVREEPVTLYSRKLEGKRMYFRVVRSTQPYRCGLVFAVTIVSDGRISSAQYSLEQCVAGEPLRCRWHTRTDQLGREIDWPEFYNALPMLELKP